jgi:phosphatidylglycerol:prolipoprotein diacylglycerol transferase
MLEIFPSRTVVIAWGNYAIYWYGVMYLLAFAMAWFLLPYLQRYRQLKLSTDDWVYALVWGILGVVVGGRLGYVLLYEPAYFGVHPREILAIWQGGMSSHGGFIGMAGALWLVSRRLRVDFWRLTDVVVIPVAIGLALGRIGNFINQELYGTVTKLPWAVVIPGVEGKRHPVQLYAALKDVFIAAVCFWYLRKKTQTGQTTALFLILYGLLRFMLEYARAQDWPLISMAGFVFTRGQLLTLPVLGLGIWLWFRTKESIQAESH